ncbi:hypothetical protein [Haloarcula salina]|uniref:Uncharacterized protein n=1 Tax=Haloarcula salina TaxID=1429914 RepID=A0AA41G084_9EURY|nr:hypothetical protein [Haloarcula salina]MBV0901830.1 hypothetical protein [Haloarcula salina]
MAGNIIADISGITGYALMIILGMAIWVGVPIANTVFGTHIMTDLIMVFNDYPIYMYRGLGGGLMGLGTISYIGFRFT